MEYLRCVVNEFGRIILMVMYDINFVVKYLDKICVMKDG